MITKAAWHPLYATNFFAENEQEQSFLERLADKYPHSRMKKRWFGRGQPYLSASFFELRPILWGVLSFETEQEEEKA